MNYSIESTKVNSFMKNIRNKRKSLQIRLEKTNLQALRCYYSHSLKFKVYGMFRLLFRREIPGNNGHFSYVHNVFPFEVSQSYQPGTVVL